MREGRKEIRLTAIHFDRIIFGLENVRMGKRRYTRMFISVEEMLLHLKIDLNLSKKVNNFKKSVFEVVRRMFELFAATLAEGSKIY